MQALHLVKFHVYAHLYALKQTCYDTLVRTMKRQEIKGILYTRYFIEIETKNNDTDNLSHNIYNVIK